jgi:AraC-like DNA-binding protein/ligand-binding sensor protein
MANPTARPSKNRVLENFMTTLHDLTGLNISFVDLGGFTKLKKFNIDEAAYAERCKFCKLMSSTKKGIKRCMDNDKKMMEKAVADRGVVISRCHAGLVDMLVPIMAEDEVLGFIFAGQVSDRELNEATSRDIGRRVSDLGYTSRQVSDALKAVPLVGKTTLRHAASLITMVAGYIASTEQMLGMFKAVKRAQGSLRVPLLSDLIYGSIKRKDDFLENFSQAFGVKQAPRGLAALKFKAFAAEMEHLGDSERLQEIDKKRVALESALKDSVPGVQGVVEYVGSGLFCILGTGKADQVTAAAMEKLARAGREAGARNWSGQVYVATGGVESSPESLYKAFNRAVVALDAEEHPHGKQVFAVDEMEDALPRLLQELSDALKFGQSEEAKALALKSLHSALSSSDSDRGRRSLMLEVLRAMAAGFPTMNDSRPALNALLYEATELAVRAEAADQDLVARLMRKVEGILAQLPEGNRDRHKDVVKRVKGYLDAHLGENVPLTKLAADFGIGQYNLSRVFRKEAGTTIKNYLAKRRVEEAAKLLTHSSSSIAEIAEKVGFHDFHYFCLVFKKLTGIPPGHFRKSEQAREKAEAESAAS